MKSLMASLALYDKILRMCLLFTKLQYLIVLKMEASLSVGMNFWFLSYLRGCLNSKILLFKTKNFKNFYS